MHRPPNAHAGDSHTKKTNNERPVEDVGERRHQDPSEEDRGLVSGVSVGAAVVVGAI